MAATHDCIDNAEQAGATAKVAFPAAVSVRYDRRVARVVIVLASGLELGFSPKQAQGLETARPIDLAKAEISPSGLGIYFPRLDVDLYIPSMLEGFLGSRRWMAAQIGKLGGKASSEAKAAAARKNGKLGGRPKKLKT
jgi:hypothetical protein